MKKSNRIVARILLLSILLSSRCAYADEYYHYTFLYENAVGNVYDYRDDSGWRGLYFEGTDEVYLDRYLGTDKFLPIPTYVDGHPVSLTNMELPYGQIEKIQISYDIVTEEQIGSIYALKEGCTLAIIDEDAYIDLPHGACKDMQITIEGLSGSTAQEFADSADLTFISRGEGSKTNETIPYIRVDAGHEDGLAATVTGGRGMDVNIESNTSWEIEVISGSEWITLSCEFGSGNGTFYTTTSDNTNGAAREGWIKVYADGCDPINIKVLQGQMDDEACTEESSPVKDFEYSISSNEVTITKYTGSDTRIVIPSKIDGYPITSIGEYAFIGNDSLASITIPNGVTSIGHEAFYECSNLTSIDIPESVTYIGFRAFNFCCQLTSIDIPNGMTSIESYTFENCENLCSVDIPSSIISIGDGAFGGCYGITNINMPDSITSIGENAFGACINLTDVEIPNSVISIGEEAFFNCKKLTNAYIPESVTSIGEDAFLHCSSSLVIYGKTGSEAEYYANKNGHKFKSTASGEDSTNVGEGSDNKPTPTIKPNTTDSNEYLGDMYIVNCNEWVSLRSQMDNTSTRLAKVPRGALVSDVSIQSSSDYAFCSYNGQTGYIQIDYLGKTPDSYITNWDGYRGDAQIINCDNWVSLRKEPDTSSEKLAEVPLGAIVDFRYDKYGDFAYVYYNGNLGYILKKYLAAQAPATTEIEDLAVSEDAQLTPTTGKIEDQDIVDQFENVAESTTAWESLIESDLGTVASLHNLEQYSVVFDNGYDDTYAYYVIDGIHVKANMGLDGEGKKFYGQKDANGNYMSAVWVHSEYDYIANFKESRSLLDNIFQVRKESSINKEYVVDGKNQNLVFSHILYMSPHDILLYKTFIEKEVSLQGIYGILHSVCTFIGLNIEEVLPYNEFLFLLFDNGDVLSGDNFNFYKIWNLVADYLLPFAEEMPAAKVFKELKSSIKFDTFWKVINEGGIPAVAANLDKIIDFKSISKSIAETGIKAALDVGEAAIKIGTAFVGFTVEWTENIAKMLGSSANVVELINGTNNMDYGLTVYFYYNPNEYVQKHEYQAYYNGRKPVDLFGTYAVYNLFEFKSPSDDERTQKGILTFDRNFVWHVLLEYLGT